MKLEIKNGYAMETETVKKADGRRVKNWVAVVTENPASKYGADYKFFYKFLDLSRAEGYLFAVATLKVGDVVKFNLTALSASGNVHKELSFIATKTVAEINENEIIFE